MIFSFQVAEYAAHTWGFTSHTQSASTCSEGRPYIGMDFILQLWSTQWSIVSQFISSTLPSIRTSDFFLSLHLNLWSYYVWFDVLRLLRQPHKQCVTSHWWSLQKLIKAYSLFMPGSTFWFPNKTQLPVYSDWHRREPVWRSSFTFSAPKNRWGWGEHFNNSRSYNMDIVWYKCTYCWWYLLLASCRWRLQRTRIRLRPLCLCYPCRSRSWHTSRRNGSHSRQTLHGLIRFHDWPSTTSNLSR